MSGSSENELKQLIRSLHLNNIGFLGTFDCRFPGFINKFTQQSAIVNTGSRESGGLHWIAFAWDPSTYKLFMFDPLGWTSAQLKQYYNFSYLNLIKNSALSLPDRCVVLERNTEAVQCTCSGSCGLFCVFFLYCFHLNYSNPFKTNLFQTLKGSRAALKPIAPDYLHFNQIVLYTFLKEHSKYFKQNATKFILNTNVGLIKTH